MPIPAGRIDELIERAHRETATSDDLDTLDAWRRESLGNEQHYRRTVRLLGELRALAGAASSTPPSVDSLLARAPQSGAASPRRRVISPWLIAGCAAVAAVLAGYGLRTAVFPSSTTTASTANGVGYSTGSSEMATVQLSDGSVVRMAPSTTLRFIQTRETREATLDGRAFFSVARIPGRVFRVRTRFGDATVLGTRFELATGSSELRLVVVSGRVGLAGATNTVEVHGGEQSGVRNGMVLVPERVPKAETMEQWVGKFLSFQDTPIREVAREIAETYGLRVVLGDSVIGSRTVTGTFTDREAKQVLDVICPVVNAQCETRPGQVVITSR